MRRVLLEHDLHISKKGSSISREKAKRSESLLQLEQSPRGIRQRRRVFQHTENGRDADEEPFLPGHDQDTEQDTKKTARILSLLVNNFQRLDRRILYQAFEIAYDTTILMAKMRYPRAKPLAVLTACYKALCARISETVNENCQVIMPQQQLYVSVVFQLGQNQIELFCLDVPNLQNDTQFFLTLKRVCEEKLLSKYLWKKYSSPNGAVEIRLIEFEIHHPSGAVSVRRTDTLPPSTHSAYWYDLPLGSDLPPFLFLMFLLFRPALFIGGDRKIWFDGKPKCTSLGPQLDQMNCSEQIGWGIQIREAWIEKIVASVFNYVSISAVLIGVLATLFNYDLRESFLSAFLSWCVMSALSILVCTLWLSFPLVSKGV
jgi:hypothetical protein